LGCLQLWTERFSVAQLANLHNFARLVAMVLMLEASVEALLGHRALVARFEQQPEVAATICNWSYCDLPLRQRE